MRATYNKPKTVNFKTSHRKERGSFHFSSYIVVDLDGECCAHRAAEFVTLRLYSTQARTTCCVWVSAGRGSGSAGGYGYHRASAAAQEALNNAGFTFDKPFDGAGDSAIEEALLAVAKIIGVAKPAIVVAHP